MEHELARHNGDPRLKCCALSPMSIAPSPIPADRLADLASADIQRQAARMAQDAFVRVFRLTVDGDEAAITAAVAEMEPMCRNWAKAAGSDDASALRLALLVAGLDQWGLAYTQAFGLVAIPGLSRLLGALRIGLDAASDARFQQQFSAMNAVESDAVDFKMELRRNIHLALWHAMIACEEREDAEAILAALGGMMVVLTQQMPSLGWRFVADALAHVQIRCLSDAAASAELAQETTGQLFNALRQALPDEYADRVFAHANQVAIAWQQARRQPN